MRQGMAEAIVKAYDEQRDAGADAGLDSRAPITLTVTLEMGDIRGLKRTLETIARMMPHANKA